MFPRSFAPFAQYVCLLACLIVGSAKAEAPPAAASASPASGKTVRLLTIGNSFSQNATHYLGDLAKADGNTLIHHGCVIGGATMEQHWTKAQTHEANPQDPNGFYSSKKSLKQELVSAPWDFVTIQQASIRSHDVATYRPYAVQLRDYVKQYAPKAELLLHETWAYRSDDPRFTGAHDGVPGEPTTQQAMYDGLSRAYREVAAELGVRLIPVGDAFRLADTDPKWGFQPDTSFDFKAAQPPALPNQTHSLHVGWRWTKDKDGKETLGQDGHHAGMAGEYLGACVFYETLFGKSAVGNGFVPKGLDPAYARFLQETAHRAVENARQPANAR